MRRLAAPAAVWAITFAAAACTREPADVGLLLRVTEGLLDTATAVELRVSLGATCNPATGHVKDEVDPQSFPLDRCGASSWCKTVKLDKDDSTRVFHVLAQNGGKTIAEGCTTTAIDKDPLDVAIKVRRYNPPGCCNDGELQSTEQCDNGIRAMTDCAGAPPKNGDNACLAVVTDEVCECDCRAREIVLSTAGTTPTTSNTPGTKSDLSLAFSGASGSMDVAGSLRAVYTDKEGVGNANDINLRTMKPNLMPIASGPLAKQLRLPALCSNVLGTGIARDQHAPSIARVSASVSAVVFVDNKLQPQQFNVSLSPLGDQGCADAEPVVVNANMATSCDFPDVAGGPDGSALVVWNQGGALRARVWKVGGQLSPASDIELGAMSKTGKPHVAGSSKGWLVVYTGASGDDVFMATVDGNGSVVGGAKQVNAVTDGIQDQPDVATQSDGRSVVVWQSGDKLLFQRFDANGQLHAGDQDTALSVEAPAATAPATPAVAGGNGWFAAAWLAGDGTVWARFIGQDAGFGYNHVDGQNGDFLATHPGILHPRTSPAVAIGDSFVAVGWQDTSSEEPVHGVIVRRFPLPE